MGALSLIRFVQARGKLVETVSLIRHFVHETFVCVRRRIQEIRMEFAWDSDYIGKTIETDLINPA